MSEHRLSAALAALVLGIISAGAGGLGSYYFAERQIEQRTRSQIGMCERITQDRVDNARAWTAVEKQVGSRAHDPTVPASERRRTSQFVGVYGESGNQLRSRLFHCGPLIRDNERIIDEDRLREAKGEL